MSRQRLIQLADERTGKISRGKLNLDAEFVTVLQDFCSSYRWYWRRKTVGFDTTPNGPTYGLAVSDGSIPAVDCEQIIRVLVFGVPGTSATYPYKKLTPLLDPELQERAIWDDTTQGPPQNYFIDPNTSNVLRLTPIPDQCVPHARRVLGDAESRVRRPGESDPTRAGIPAPSAGEGTGSANLPLRHWTSECSLHDGQGGIRSRT